MTNLNFLQINNCPQKNIKMTSLEFLKIFILLVSMCAHAHSCTHRGQKAHGIPWSWVTGVLEFLMWSLGSKPWSSRWSSQSSECLAVSPTLTLDLMHSCLPVGENISWKRASLRCGNLILALGIEKKKNKEGRMGERGRREEGEENKEEEEK